MYFLGAIVHACMSQDNPKSAKITHGEAQVHLRANYQTLVEDEACRRDAGGNDTESVEQTMASGGVDDEQI